eukprot:10782571-Alexandrium_andersonii.AAC.1
MMWHSRREHSDHFEHFEHAGFGSDPHCGVGHFDPRLPSPYAQSLAGIVPIRQLSAGGAMAVLGHMAWAAGRRTLEAYGLM